MVPFCSAKQENITQNLQLSMNPTALRQQKINSMPQLPDILRKSNTQISSTSFFPGQPPQIQPQLQQHVQQAQQQPVMSSVIPFNQQIFQNSMLSNRQQINFSDKSHINMNNATTIGKQLKNTFTPQQHQSQLIMNPQQLQQLQQSQQQQQPLQQLQPSQHVQYSNQISNNAIGQVTISNNPNNPNFVINSHYYSPHQLQQQQHQLHQQQQMRPPQQSQTLLTDVNLTNINPNNNFTNNTHLNIPFDQLQGHIVQQLQQTNPSNQLQTAVSSSSTFLPASSIAPQITMIQPVSTLQHPVSPTFETKAAIIQQSVSANEAPRPPSVSSSVPLSSVPLSSVPLSSVPLSPPKHQKYEKRQNITSTMLSSNSPFSNTSSSNAPSPSYSTTPPPSVLPLVTGFDTTNTLSVSTTQNPVKDSTQRVTTAATTATTTATTTANIVPIAPMVSHNNVVATNMNVPSAPPAQNTQNVQNVNIPDNYSTTESSSDMAENGTSLRRSSRLCSRRYVTSFDADDQEITENRPHTAIKRKKTHHGHANYSDDDNNDNDTEYNRNGDALYSQKRNNQQNETKKRVSIEQFPQQHNHLDNTSIPTTSSLSTTTTTITSTTFSNTPASSTEYQNSPVITSITTDTTVLSPPHNGSMLTVASTDQQVGSQLSSAIEETETTTTSTTAITTRPRRGRNTIANERLPDSTHLSTSIISSDAKSSQVNAAVSEYYQESISNLYQLDMEVKRETNRLAARKSRRRKRLHEQKRENDLATLQDRVVQLETQVNTAHTNISLLMQYIQLSTGKSVDMATLSQTVSQMKAANNEFWTQY